MTSRSQILQVVDATGGGYTARVLDPPPPMCLPCSRGDHGYHSRVRDLCPSCHCPEAGTRPGRRRRRPSWGGE